MQFLQGTCLGCGPGPQLGAYKRQQTNAVALKHHCFSPSLSHSLPLSLKINKIFLKKGIASIRNVVKWNIYVWIGSLGLVKEWPQPGPNTVPGFSEFCHFLPSSGSLLLWLRTKVATSCAQLLPYQPRNLSKKNTSFPNCSSRNSKADFHYRKFFLCCEEKKHFSENANTE